jgi:hypothetical protein
MGVGSLKRNWITYPDDPANCFAYVRAWDRFLASIGLLPIYTFDPLKVGPILLGPDPEGKQYIEYRIDRDGCLTATVQEFQVQEAARSSYEEQRIQIQ